MRIWKQFKQTTAILHVIKLSAILKKYKTHFVGSNYGAFAFVDKVIFTASKLSMLSYRCVCALIMLKWRKNKSTNHILMSFSVKINSILCEMTTIRGLCRVMVCDV